MARYIARVQSRANAKAVYEYLADFTTIAEWDPGISSAELVSGEPATTGAIYRVVASFGPRKIPLDYRVLFAAAPQPKRPRNGYADNYRRGRKMQGYTNQCGLRSLLIESYVKWSCPAFFPYLSQTSVLSIYMERQNGDTAN